VGNANPFWGESKLILDTLGGFPVDTGALFGFANISCQLVEFIKWLVFSKRCCLVFLKNQSLDRIQLKDGCV